MYKIHCLFKYLILFRTTKFWDHSFNVSNFSNIILRIINIEGEIVAEEKIQNKQKQYTFNGEEMDPGQYQASLECDDLIPIAIDIEKE